MFKINRIATGLIGAAALVFANVASEANAASSVADDPAAANTLVTAVTSSAASTATASLVAGAIATAIAPPAPSISVPSGGGGGATPTAPGQQSFNFFNTRSIAGKNAGGMSPKMGFWIQGSGSAIDNDENGGQFDGSLYNLVAGIDRKINNKMVAGVAVSYEMLDIDTTFNTGTFEGTGVSVVPYLGVSLNKAWSADLSLGYGWIDYDISRTSSGTKITGSTDAERMFVSGNVGGNFYKKKIRISPRFGLLAVREKMDGYTESNGTAAKGNTTDLVRANGGVTVGYNAGKVEPYFLARGEYDISHEDAATLTTGQVASNDKFGAVFGVGMNITGSKATGQVEATSEQFRNEMSNYTMKARVRFNF